MASTDLSSLIRRGLDQAPGTGAPSLLHLAPEPMHLLFTFFPSLFVGRFLYFLPLHCCVSRERLSPSTVSPLFPRPTGLFFSSLRCSSPPFVVLRQTPDGGIWAHSTRVNTSQEGRRRQEEVRGRNTRRPWGCERRTPAPSKRQFPRSDSHRQSRMDVSHCEDHSSRASYPR